MAKTFLTSINLNKNELQNALIHPLATAPLTPGEGQIYYNSGSKKLFIYDGTAWLDITGAIRALASDTPALTIDITDPANPRLAIADADAVNSGLLSTAFFNDLTNATELNTGGTLVKRDASGNVAFQDVTTNSVTITANPVNATDAVNKQYVDNLVASGMTIKGAIDCSTNPNYPSGVVGDAYHVSVAGLIGGASGEPVTAGDLILCIADNPGGDQATVGTSWIIMQENVDQATDTVIGLARIATQAEVDAGTEAQAYVTPATLQAKLANVGTGNVNKAVATVGDGVNTLFTVNHNLGEQYCNVQIFDAVTNEEVIADIELFDINNVKVAFNVPPSLNEYRVVIEG